MNENARPSLLRKNSGWLIAAAVLVAWGLVLTFRGPKGPKGDLTAPSLLPAVPPRAAEYSWRLEDLDGHPTDLTGLRDRVLVVNVWATWCPPCRAEMPALVTLASNDRLRSRKVAFVAVATDDDREVVRKFVREHKMDGLLVLRAASVPEVFQTQGIPATFVVGPDGRIVTEQIGSAQWDSPEVVDYLERLATPSAPG